MLQRVLGTFQEVTAGMMGVPRGLRVFQVIAGGLRSVLGFLEGSEGLRLFRWSHGRYRGT